MPSNFTVAFSAYFPSVSLVFNMWKKKKAAIHQTRPWGAEHPRKERGTRQSGRDGTENHRPQKRAATRQVTAGRRCVRASPHAVQQATPNRKGQTEKQREMNGCRQEALTTNMAREHAATPRRNTGEIGERRKKQEAAQNTRKKQIAGGKGIAKGLTLAGDSTPALTHTHHRSAVSPWVRGFGPPHNKRAHTTTASSSIPRTTAYSHSPAANTLRTRSKQSPKEPHAEAIPHPSMTRRLSPCGHTEHTVSSIDLIRHPSLKNASVSDGS
ncbi:hypothetical protein TcCL_NonESM10688 [Trypanosoma cruzi]|nr:hypothetical protein TcCL_NonESM10688 [Trypanosoma cruzi]